MECKHDRYSLGHHLIYKEELEKDGEKEVLCSWCVWGEPIRGSLHNWVECCFLSVHRYSSNEPCLDFTEKLENDGNNKVVCFACDEPVLGAAYKCSISDCSFVIHKLCTELSYQLNHPLHPGHTLYLKSPGRNRCDACCRSHDSFFFYCCHPCDFQLEIKCDNHLPINPNDCHQHEFFPILKWIQLNCEVCGGEITNIANLCSICKLLVHKRCVEIPRMVKIKLHNHFRALTYSLPEIKKHDNMFCRICYEKVNTDYAVCFCQECSYNVHIECLIRFRTKYGESPATSESVPNESIGQATHLIKVLNQTEDEVLKY